MFKRIIVGLDGSDSANTAIHLACDLAGKYDAELHLMHVPRPETVAFALGAVAGYHMVTTMPPAHEVDEAAEAVVAAGKALVEGAGGTVAGAYIGQGEAGDAIVEKANEIGADLIVTGRRGLGGLGTLVQGSTTQRIGHLATCACLSVV